MWIEKTFNFRFSNCWPAIQRGSNGVMFVYNRGKDEHAKYLEFLHAQFVSQQGLKDNQCIVLCHSKPDSDGYPGKLCKYFVLIDNLTK